MVANGTSGQAQEEPRDELRLALVLNGGVSLAVWISGVVNEVDALRFYGDGGAPVGEATPKHDCTGAIYSDLKDLLGMRVVVDVIAGTSAGGLNGALMAAGIANRKRVSPVRETWLDSGQMSDLLRSPSEPDPPSLMKGDEKLLVAVKQALQVYFSAPMGPGPETSARVTLTTTDLFGVAEDPLKDSYGDDADRIERRLHQRFHTPGLTDAEGVPITDGAIGAMARAARSSASFPFAFEPSEIVAAGPIVNAVYTYDDRTQPLTTPGSVSRWTMDGGVLDNSPIDVVLNDIQSQPAGARPVRRAMIFIVPYAGHTTLELGSADHANLRRVLDTTINSPRDLPDLENLNRVLDRLCERRRTGRDAENVLLRMAPASLEELEALCNPAPDGAPQRVGRRALDRLRDARANIPMDPWGDVAPSTLEQVRARLKAIHRHLHRVIWDAGSFDDIAKQLRRARIQVTRLSELRPDVYRALPEELTVVTGERLRQADRVLQTMVVTEKDRETDAGFRFMRLCADARHVGQTPGDDTDSRRPNAKLYGLELGHFGGFVRRSWRANDWMWGRLDGAARLVDVILAPSHLADHPVTRQTMWDRLAEWLPRIHLTQAQFENLLPEADRFIMTPDVGRIHPGEAGSGAGHDDASAELRAWRTAWRIVLQVAILRAELPELTKEVAKATKDGFRPNPSPGVQAGTPTVDLLASFRTYCAELDGHIHEIVKDEANSRQGARMLATAVAVTGNVLGSRTSGLPGIASAAIRTTRGALKLVRAAVMSMTGSLLERTAFVIGVALAGLAIGITTIPDLVPGAGAKGSSTTKGVALTLALPVLAVALAGAHRPARRLWVDRVAVLLLGACYTLGLAALALWLWGRSTVMVAQNISETHTVWWVLIVLVALSTVIGWTATMLVRFEAVAGALVVGAAAAGFAVWRGWLDWAVTRAGGKCTGGLSNSCVHTLAGHAVEKTEVRLGLAAVACFVLAKFMAWISDSTPTPPVPP